MRRYSFGRKTGSMLLILALLLPSFGATAYGEETQGSVSLTSPAESQTYAPGERVQIEGTASGVREVAVLVSGKGDQVLYAAQAAVVQNRFSCGFTLDKKAEEGTCAVEIGGYKLQPVKRTFRISAQSPGGNVPGPSPGPGAPSGGGGPAGEGGPVKEELEAPKEAVLDASHIKSEIRTGKDGTKTEYVTIQPEAAAEAEKMGKGGRMVIIAPGGPGEADGVQVTVPPQVVEKTLSRQLWIGIRTGLGEYSVPPLKSLTEAAKTAGVAEKELMIRAVLAKADKETADRMRSALGSGGRLAGDPVVFKLTAGTEGKETELKDFGGEYAARSLTLPEAVDPGHAVGVVLDEKRNVLRPLPTLFEKAGGKTVAVILSRTNSVYGVAETEKTFEDTRSSWAKKEIETLASKLLIKGRSESLYEPGGSVTRAEFAALLVRALGIPAEDRGQVFADVPAESWCAAEVAAASREKLILGFDGNLFKPDQPVSRQEMAVMIGRAAAAAGKKESLNDTEKTALLSAYRDRDRIATWAAEDVAAAARSRIMTGMGEETFSPETYADRAQCAAILKRFMVECRLMSGE